MSSHQRTSQRIPECPPRKKVLPELEKHQNVVNQISEFGSNGSSIFDPNFEKHFPTNFDKSPFDQIQESYDPIKNFDENKHRATTNPIPIHRPSNISDTEERKRRITATTNINNSMESSIMQDSGNANSDWMFNDTVGPNLLKQDLKPQTNDSRTSNCSPAYTTKAYNPNETADMLDFDRASVLSEMSAQQAELAMIRRNSAVSLLGNSQFSVNQERKPKCLGKRSLPDLGILKSDKIKKFDDYYIGRPSVIRKSRKLAHNIGQAITDLPRRFSRKMSKTELSLPKKSRVFRHLVSFSLIFQLGAVIVLLLCYNHVSLSVKFENVEGNSKGYGVEMNEYLGVVGFHENQRLISDDRDSRSVPNHRGHIPKKG